MAIVDAADPDFVLRSVGHQTHALTSVVLTPPVASVSGSLVKARGHFPTEQAAMRCLYLVIRSLDPKGAGQTRWATRCKPALNVFAITFADRMPTKTN